MTHKQFLPRPICRSVSEDFCSIKFGGFLRGFSWRILLGTFSHKNEKSGEKIREKIRRPKNKKTAKQSVLPKPDPTIPLRKGSSVSWLRSCREIAFRMQTIEGWSPSYRSKKLLLFPQKNEWSQSYREIHQHPCLPENFMTQYCLRHSSPRPLFCAGFGIQVPALIFLWYAFPCYVQLFGCL